jgi:hypothetical protein
MAALSSEERRRVVAECQRPRHRLAPPGWSKEQLRDAVDSIDDDLDGLIATVASGFGIGATAAARNLITYDALYAVMQLAPYRTAVDTIQSDAETAAGATFTAAGESGALGTAMGRMRFALIKQALIKRRLGEFPAEED